MELIVTGICWYVTFVFCTVLHEAAHAWSAKMGGDLTAYYGGQVSIDPVPHIRREPIGMVVIPLISVFVTGWPLGYASAPYDPYWADRYPKRAAWMALAGPVANLLTVLTAGILIRVGLVFHVFVLPNSIGLTTIAVGASEGAWTVLAMFLSMLFSLGLILAVFNMIPIPPLDGAGVLPLFLNNELIMKYRHIMGQPGFALMGLIIAWNIFGPVFRPIFHIALRLLYPWLK